MTVKIKHGKFRLALWLPTSCLGFAVKKVVTHARKEAEKKGEEVKALDKKVIRQITKDLKTAKKIHGKLELVSIQSADGTKVRIVL